MDMDEEPSLLIPKKQYFEEPIFDRLADSKTFETKIKGIKRKMNEKEEEIQRLRDEVRRLRSEKKNANKYLEEEREVNKELENLSQGLVSDIKGSYKKKVGELEKEVKVLMGTVEKKTAQLKDFENIFKSYDSDRAKIIGDKLEKTQNEMEKLNNEYQELLLQNKELERKIAFADNDMKSMQVEFRVASRKEREAKVALRKLNEEFEEMTAKSERMEVEYRLLEEKFAKNNDTLLNKNSRIESIDHKLQEKNDEIKKLIEELEEVKEERENCKILCAEEGKKLAKSDTALRKLNEEFEELSAKSERMEEEYQLLEEKFAKNNDTLLNKTSRIESIDHKLHEKNEEIKKLTEEVEEVKDELEKCKILREEEGKKLAKLENAHKENYELMAKNLGIESENQLLEHRIENLEKVIESKTLEIENSSKKWLNRDDEINKLKGEVQKNIDEFRKTNNELTKTKNELERSKILREEESRKLTKLDNALKENYELNAKTQRLEAENRLLEYRIERKDKLLETKASEVETNSKKWLDKEDEINKLKDELKKNVDELERCKNSQENESKKLSDLENELKEAQKSLEGKDAKIGGLTTKAKKLKDVCTVLETQLKEFENILAEKNCESELISQKKTMLEEDLSRTKEELKKNKIDLQEMTSLKIFAERKYNDLETTFKSAEIIKSGEVSSLSNQMNSLIHKNNELQRFLDAAKKDIGELNSAKLILAQTLEKLQEQNKHFQDDGTKVFHEYVRLKESNIQLNEGLTKALIKGEEYKKKFESTFENLQLVSAEKKSSDLNIIQLKEKEKQQAKLINHLQEQNQVLGKKKTWSDIIFGKEKAPSKEYINNCTPQKIMQEQKKVKGLEETAAELKNNLAKLKSKKQTTTTVEHEQYESEAFTCPKVPKSPKKQECLLLREKSDCDKWRVVKDHLFVDDSNSRLSVNCMNYLFSDLYLLGTDDGLYSLRAGQENRGLVKIEGTESVHQVEILTFLNFALMIEGKDRNLILVHLGILRIAAEAAACSKPAINFAPIEGIRHCNLFQVHKNPRGNEVVLAVASNSHIKLYSWTVDRFEVRKSIRTVEPVTCLLITPSSVIFGCEKVYELDIKNFTMEEFLDEGDATVFYMLANAAGMKGFPLAILNVGITNKRPEESHYRPEYLLCFPDCAIFVDAFGRRSRSEDINWSKVPKSISFRNPNLYVVHFDSVMIINISYDSFTRISTIDDEEPPVIKDIQIKSPKLLGDGAKSSSVIIGSIEKTKNEFFELTLEESIVLLREDSDAFSEVATSSYPSEDEISSSSSSKSKGFISSYSSVD